MTIKTVLAVLGVDHWADDLSNAVKFCEGHDAHLTALVMSMGAVPAIATYQAISTAWLDEQQREIEHLGEEAAAVKAELRNADLSSDVQEIYTEFAWVDDDIAERSLYADLVLVEAQTTRDEPLRKRVIDGALFQSPTPILINPAKRPMTTSPKSVLLAWDSSNEAARAARQSLDFLKASDTVHVTLIDPVSSATANGEEPGADIAAYLARHGINVEVDRVPSGGRRVDEALRQHALDVAADLIVMGAYNHPRLQQRLFGGVTQSMLKDSTVPMFLSR